ncbi:MAG: SPOR domain-containing protein [Candidatus Zixiibacteriota bacterium]|nr:MAG: SPOR domain-containing protein [candidate division Zixibacteria bacterium]
MRRLMLLLVVAVVTAASDAAADKIYSLIRQGKLREAADSLSGVSTASTRDGNKLFFSSLLERDAEKSARLMEAALSASVSAVYRQEIYYRLAQFHFIKGDYTRLGQLVSEYLAYWEAGKYRPEMLRFSILLDELDGAYDAAVRQSDRYLLEYSSGTASQWGLVDKARVMTRFDKQVGAHNLLRRLSREKSGPGVAQALYMLTHDAIDKKKTDDAVFYYNLMREAFPRSVGLDALLEEMGVLASGLGTDNRAEKLTGTYYSVQVGVFSVKNNARRQADIFKKYDRPVDIKEKKISNNKYHVVYVGRFSDFESARGFKTMLENNHKEVYQVVAR